MNLVEVIVGIVITVMALILGLNFFSLNSRENIDYKIKILQNSQKINLYNFSENLVNLSELNNGYIYFSGDNFVISTGFNKDVDNYYFECFIDNGNLIKTNMSYNVKFCKIQFGNDLIWNYSLQ